MPYRPTERTEAKRAATRERVVAAARALIAHGGYRDAQVAAVAARAGVATGTVYRHFPSKADLFAEVFRSVSQREVDAARAAADAAPAGTAAGRLAAAIETFARRALRARRQAWALLAEPVDPAVEAERLTFRRAYADLFARALAEAPHPYPEIAAAAIVGGLAEALVGPLARRDTDADELAAALTDFTLSAVGADRAAQLV